jgi:hypothetical protein
MEVACQCWHWDGNPDEHLMSVTEGTHDPDWRIREWAANMSGHVLRSLARGRPRQNEASEGVGTEAPRWEELLLDLKVDPHAHVRAQASRSLRTAREPLAETAREAELTRVDALVEVAAGATAEEIAHYPLLVREHLAAGEAGPVPVVLLDDPVCRVRLTTLRNTQPERVPSQHVPGLRVDPCEQVRHEAVGMFGPDEMRPVSELDLDERQALARLTADPTRLTALAGDPTLAVRVAVARNEHCPASTLLDLARDPVVFGPALANPNWPAGVPAPDPFA